MNSFPTLVLFNSGASQYFVSLSFSRDFVMTLGELAFPLPTNTGFLLRVSFFFSEL